MYPLYQTTDTWSEPNVGSYEFTPWDGLIFPYVKSYQIFRCPSSSSSSSSVSATMLNGNYGANNDLFENTANLKSISLAAVQSPASTYMIMDAGTYLIFPVKAMTASIGWNYVPGTGGAGGDCSGLNSANPVYRSFVTNDCQTDVILEASVWYLPMVMLNGSSQKQSCKRPPNVPTVWVVQQASALGIRC